MSEASAPAAPQRPEALMARARALVLSLGAARGGAFAFVIGALGAFAYAPFYAWPMLVVSCTGLVWLIDAAAARGRSAVIAAAWRGWCFGTGHFLAGVWWIGSAFVSRGPEYAPFAAPAAVALALGLGLLWALAAATMAAFWTDGWRRIVRFALIAVIVEFVRGNALTGFPWNLPAHVWPAGGAVSQTAAVIGAYGLSAVTLFVCAAPAALAGPGRSAREGWALVTGAAALLIALFAAGALRLAAAGPTPLREDVRLRLVQPQISQAEKWRPGNRDAIRDRYLTLTAAEGLETRTHVIWPESALPLFLLEEPRVLDRIGATLSDGQTLLTGAIRRDLSDPRRPLLFNSLLALDIRGRTPIVAAVYDKHRLVPFGEFLPLAGLLASLDIPNLSRLEEGYTRGPGPATITVPDAPPLSPQICYESAYAGVTRRGDERPAWIINVSNDAWYGDSPGPRQSFNQARYRAIEEGVPLVRSATGGVSAIVDPFGRTVARLPMTQEGVLDAELPAARPATVYALVGDASLVVLLVFAALVGFGRPRS